MYTDFRQKHLNEGALAAFGRAAELSPTPTTWNNVAYQLALKGAYLDRAQQYAESALSAVAIDSRNFTIGHITARELAITQSIASHLDTLGWVAFAKGDLAQAEKLIEAAWWIVENGEIGRVHQRRREAQANVGRAESAPVSGCGYRESAGEGGASGDAGLWKQMHADSNPGRRRTTAEVADAVPEVTFPPSTRAVSPVDGV